MTRWQMLTRLDQSSDLSFSKVRVLKKPWNLRTLAENPAQEFNLIDQLIYVKTLTLTQ